MCHHSDKEFFVCGVELPVDLIGVLTGFCVFLFVKIVCEELKLYAYITASAKDCMHSRFTFLLSLFCTSPPNNAL